MRVRKLTAVIAMALLAGACHKGQDTAEAHSAPSAVTVGPENIAVVDSTQLQIGPVISGSLQPGKEATVRAQVSGAVLATYVEEGEAVKKGQLLARLDATALQDAYLSAKQGARSAESALAVAQRNAERSRTLAKAGAIAPRDLEAAEQAETSARAAAADAKARLAAAQQQLSYATVEAPFTGRVSQRQAEAGDVVQPGGALFTIVNASTLQLEASVPAEQAGELRVGAPVVFSVNGYPNRTFNGTVDRINPTADPSTRQVRIYATIPNQEESLVGGLFAQGQVTLESREALLVPSSAVNQTQVTPTVTRLVKGKAQPTAVELGARDEQHDRIEITRGLSVGDTVLLGSAQGVTPGTPIRIIKLTDQTAAER